MKSTLFTLALTLPILTTSYILPSKHNAVLLPHIFPSSRVFPIGTGDRFANGSVPPVGLGTGNRTFSSVLNPTEIASGLRALAAQFPDEARLFSPPFTTYHGARLTGASVGPNPRVFVMSGVHARERGGPDHLLYLLADLLQARKTGTGLIYGSRSYTPAQVVAALSVGVVVLPLINPDGVSHDQATGTCWRKNRNPAYSIANPGVDLNRNFDFLWDYGAAFSPGADTQLAGSDDPASEVFHGTEPMSEPETKSVA